MAERILNKSKVRLKKRNGVLLPDRSAICPTTNDPIRKPRNNMAIMMLSKLRKSPHSAWSSFMIIEIKRRIPPSAISAIRIPA